MKRNENPKKIQTSIATWYTLFMDFLARFFFLYIGMKGVASGLNLTRNTKHKNSRGSCKYDKCEGNI
jgi:hypothetical protein